MYRILCVSSGTYVKWPMNWYITNAIWPIPNSINGQNKPLRNVTQTLVPVTVQTDAVNSYKNNFKELRFSNWEIADWFIRRRLVFNQKRTDPTKLAFMLDLLEASDISDWQTVKLDFNIEEI